jgi:hypothetical protein
VVWFGQAPTTVVAAPNGALAPRFAPAAVVQVRAPPPSIELACESPIQRLDGGGSNGKRWLGWEQNPHRF